MTTPKQLVLPLLLAVLLIPMQGCELLFEVGELEIAGEVGEAAATVGEFSGSSAALRAAAMEDIAIGRGGLRAGLGAAAEETAAGRFTTITSEGEIVARGRTWGRVASDGDIFLRQTTRAAEARVGRVANGFVWAPDEGGNLLPTARIRGSLRSSSYKLRSSRAGSLNGMTLSRDVDIDVLRVDKGWYEVRAAGTKTTGWVDGSLLSVALSAAAGLDRVAGAVLT
jgi:hypothetical protein